MDAMMRIFYPFSHTKALAKLIGYSCTVIYGRAEKLGLKKTPWYQQTPMASRMRPGGPHIGTKTQFKKGLSSWNRGVSYQPGGRCSETQFKPGHKPKNWRPVGSTRISKDGYIEMKMAEGMFQYRLLHKVVWERMNGHMPDGHIVTFIDGDKQNVRITNLRLMTLQENMQRNSVHNLPGGMNEVVLMRAKLNRKINELCKTQPI